MFFVVNLDLVTKPYDLAFGWSIEYMGDFVATLNRRLLGLIELTDDLAKFTIIDTDIGVFRSF